jgi:nicotinate-nucleotide--dimethylbenzimidazole phosphoribosyltransferase
MSTLAETLARIAPPDPEIARRTQALLDGKTKPRRSLGRLEDLACRVAAARGVAVPEAPVKAVVVMAADHGVTAEGVSAYPSEVTWQMVANFVRGGAAINVLARQAGAEVVVVDLGVKAPVDLPGVRAARIGPGTGNLAREPAMSRAQAVAALEVGIGIAEELAARGVTLIATGEMGIGNTTPATALAAHFTGASPEEVVGRGTGIDDAGLRRKLDAIRRGLALHGPAIAEPLDALARLGGFEIAGLAGLVLGAASRRVPVLVDGFISGAAALAMHLVEAAIRILREMATFADAGVSDSGA